MKRKAHPHEHEVELNLIPYLDIMVNLVMFMLLSMTGFLSFQMVNVNMPDLSAGAASDTPTPKTEAEKLTLNVSIATTGFFIAATGGVLPGIPSTGDAAAPGGAAAAAADPKAAPTIPFAKNKDGKMDYDFTTLTARMSEIKKAYPSVSQFFLAADKTVSYDVIIHTMDATRGDATKPLFPDVAFAAIM